MVNETAINTLQTDKRLYMRAAIKNTGKKEKHFTLISTI